MKTLLTLALSALLFAAHGQTPATSPDKLTPAAPRAKPAKTLGQKMVQQSKPTDTVLPHKVIKK
ncbi:hypothetical protein [Hymenobacter bucti]|uniref:Acid-shock protein n=1 Tax=Hymenobacter bucti TaxID=1844114 RepID=A0ABW4QYR5_9BACT